MKDRLLPSVVRRAAVTWACLVGEPRGGHECELARDLASFLAPSVAAVMYVYTVAAAAAAAADAASIKYQK